MFEISCFCLLLAFDILTLIQNLIYKQIEKIFLLFFSCLFSFIKQNHFHRHSSLYLFITIAFLLLGLTNAAENNTNVDQGFLGKLKALPGRLLENLTEGLHENSTTNQSSNDNETSIFHKPKNINDVKNILLVILRLLAQALMIVSY